MNACRSEGTSRKDRNTSAMIASRSVHSAPVYVVEQLWYGSGESLKRVENRKDSEAIA